LHERQQLERSLGVMQRLPPEAGESGSCEAGRGLLGLPGTPAFGVRRQRPSACESVCTGRVTIGNPRRRSVKISAYRATVFAAALVICGCRPSLPPPAPPPPPPPPAPAAEVPATSFEATAYSVEGQTASGAQTRGGIVAADPKVLPIGSRIRVSGAGHYDGEYTVKDTGREIKGREIDIYIANDGEAKRFGRKNVTVEVLEHSDRQRPGTQ
jgi:3D (Asp-Asp-Asp) domain-containing protein